MHVNTLIRRSLSAGCHWYRVIDITTQTALILRKTCLNMNEDAEESSYKDEKRQYYSRE